MARFAACESSTQADPEKYFYPDQYSNPANPPHTTNTPPPKFGNRPRGRITHFVAGLGTSGTFVGTSRRLKELNPAIRCISFQPDSGFHGLEGLKHMATAIVPKIYDPALADEDIAVQTEDAQKLAKRLAREEGLLVGVSAAGALWASMHVAKQLATGEACGDRHRVPRFGGQISERTILERGMSAYVLKLSNNLAAKIQAHGMETYPHECCGAILGRDENGSREVLGSLASSESS